MNMFNILHYSLFNSPRENMNYVKELKKILISKVFNYLMPDIFFIALEWINYFVRDDGGYSLPNQRTQFP